MVGRVALDVDYESILAAPVHHASVTRIPKVVHFVFVELRPIAWIEYAAVCSAWKIIGAEKINLWVPEGQEFPGKMWALVLKIPSVVVRPMRMPNRVFGREIRQLAHTSDVVRLKVLYEEEGKTPPSPARSRVAMQSSTTRRVDECKEYTSITTWWPCDHRTISSWIH